MKRIAKGIALLVALGFAGSAWASSVGRALPAAANTAIAAYAGEFTIARELLGGTYTVNLDAAVNTPNGRTNPGGTIRYVPTFGLNEGDIITFTLTNAKFMDASYFLLAEEAAAQQSYLGAAQDINEDADSLDVVEVASNFGTTDSTNGVSSIQVRINTGVRLPTGVVLTLVASNASAEANGDGVLNNTSDNATVRLDANLAAGSAVGLAAAAKNTLGLDIPAAAATNSLIDVATQFGLAVTGATSEINVESSPSRSDFTEEGAANDVLTSANDTDLNASAALVTWTNAAGILGGAVEDYIVLGADDALTLTLTTNAGSYSSLPTTKGPLLNN